MNAAVDPILTREFQLFARHITRIAPSAYQAEQYCAAHQRFDLSARSGFDAWLLAIARSSRAGLWLTDGYSGLFARKSIVRSKLVLTLAILESAAPTFSDLDQADASGWLALVAAGAEAALSATLGAILLGPSHLWFAVIKAGR